MHGAQWLRRHRAQRTTPSSKQSITRSNSRWHVQIARPANCVHGPESAGAAAVPLFLGEGPDADGMLMTRAAQHSAAVCMGTTPCQRARGRRVRARERPGPLEPRDGAPPSPSPHPPCIPRSTRLCARRGGIPGCVRRWPWPARSADARGGVGMHPGTQVPREQCPQMPCPSSTRVGE